MIDFGLSALADAARLTAVGTCIGSPTYLAPERALELDYDARADIYAAGVIFYELLAGAPPFSGKTPAETARLHIEKTPEPIERLRPDVSPGLAQLIHRALAKDPAERFASAGDMLATLRALPPASTARYPISAPADAPAEPTIPLSTRSITFVPEPKWRRLGRWLARLGRPRDLVAR